MSQSMRVHSPILKLHTVPKSNSPSPKTPTLAMRVACSMCLDEHFSLGGSENPLPCEVRLYTFSNKETEATKGLSNLPKITEFQGTRKINSQGVKPSAHITSSLRLLQKGIYVTKTTQCLGE